MSTLTAPEPALADAEASVLDEVTFRLGERVRRSRSAVDGVPTIWVGADDVIEVLRVLKRDMDRPFTMLADLFAMDERTRRHRLGQPAGDFTLVYHLMSYARNADIRVKLALAGEPPSAPTLTGLWPAANWYEREAYDMFGIRFEGHPHLTRILMPPTWEGYPLRKDHHARATEVDVYRLSEEGMEKEQEALKFRPEDWGMKRRSDEADFLFLNLGPNHPSVHGVFRVVLQLDGEEILDAVPDIGYHHRGAEKMGERQTWHSYIPYTDRIDYLGGVMNNLPYVMAVETMAGIDVPPRARMARIMLSECFRISSHLLFFGTMAQDLGAMSPVFYMFEDREKIYDIVEAICGFRMHPSWFRIGGLAQDLPEGWDRLVREFVDYFPPRLAHYEKMVLKNGTFRARTKGVGAYTTEEAIEWGVTGPGLRATGFEWDLRKMRPYSGFEDIDFDVPTGTNGDCFDRTVVRVEEMRQSTRIIRQCLENMPAGPYIADHPLAVPPRKDRTMHDIETLINHFVHGSWGPAMPAAETGAMVEATKGMNSYYLVSDEDTMSYRTRIRTPTFPHLQMIPEISRGLTVADVIAILGSIDYVMADCDR